MSALHVDYNNDQKGKESIDQVLDNYRKTNKESNPSTLNLLAEDEKLKSDKYIKESIVKISKCHNQLQTLLDNFDSKLEKVISSQEQEFTKAFKFYVVKAQKDLHELKKEAHEVQVKVLKDDSVKSLETEITNLKEELARVYKKLQAQSTQIADFKRIIEGLKSEKDYLQSFVYETSRDARVLKQEYLNLVDELAELKVKNEKLEKEKEKDKDRDKILFSVRKINESVKKTTDNDSSVRSTIDFESSSSKKTGRKEYSVFESMYSRFSGLKTPSIKHQNQSVKKLDMADKENTINLIVEDYMSHKNIDILKNAMIEMVRKIEEERTMKIEHLDQSLKKLKKEKLQLSKMVTHKISENNDYEDLFIDCVRQAKKEVEKRMNLPSRDDLISTITFKQFLKTDKLKIIESFLTNEVVMTKIFDLIFPGKTIAKSSINEENSLRMNSTDIIYNDAVSDKLDSLNRSFDVSVLKPTNPKVKLPHKLYRISNGKLLKNTVEHKVV